MTKAAEQIDNIEMKVMSLLKDFQRATVNRIDYLYRNGQRRILVSDEVGLGKTLIARGVVAKMAKLRMEEGDNLLKVVYICSNAAIAGQNLNKLRITNEIKTENTSSSRLSMQHLNIFKQENDTELLDSHIQLIPLTPDTSFRMSAGAGTVQERALMFAILRRLPELKNYIAELEEAMTDKALSAWDSKRNNLEKDVEECDKKNKGMYLKYMKKKLSEELTKIWQDNMRYIDGLRKFCRAIRKHRDENLEERKIISHIRHIFAKISLEKLKPDLVIMDEFQRFKYLIQRNDSETGMLAEKFFDSKEVRILLLSATPYKMYSTPEEIDEERIDEHYSEFLSVMKFLNNDASSMENFRTVWRDYSVKLKEMKIGDTAILAAKNAAENEMYKTVCRTERLSENKSADIIDDKDVDITLEVLEQDIKSYIQAQKLLDEIGENYHIPVDYVKSSPYILSFMRDYQLKRNIENYFRKHSDEHELRKIKKDTLWINRKKINNYEKIPSNNARLERVMKIVFQQGAEKLLWIPPSKPYYEMQGVFRDSALFSKTIIFSSWEMVPRMLASLISYEAERNTVGKLAKDYDESNVRYFYRDNEDEEKKRYPSARMNFSVRNGIPASMTLFCLLYPSQFLAGCYNPVQCMNDDLCIREIQRNIRGKITEKLADFPVQKNGNYDKRWYYIAPLLMDGEEYASEWIKEYKTHYDDYTDENNKKKKGFIAHIESLQELFTETLRNSARNLGRRPKDLVEVLTDMAIASPAICIYRTYIKYLCENEDFYTYFPSQLARIFINRMNTAESTAAVELACGRKSDDAHWQNVLTYCRQGNIQAVFDEYAHLIASGIEQENMQIKEIHKQMKDAMTIRTTQYNADTYNNFCSRIKGERENPANIRTHFAVAFNKGEGRDSDTQRKNTIRNAFNSPFRPFVLATTSIGQEGLDFHNYCRKIVHWNLPSNPIDIEQREGRINRFECLAIRQNVAKRYGNIKFKKDVWNEMFEEAARQEKHDGSSDLIPFWGLSKTDDMVKIERIVPMYPFSRDGFMYERLIKILSMYRLTLGHARQEELLEYLFKNCNEPEKLKKLFINLSPFYKKR